MSKAEQKADELIEMFKPFVYPYLGSDMLINRESESVILRNSCQCAIKCVDEIIKVINGYSIHSDCYEESSFEFWQSVKQHLLNKGI